MKRFALALLICTFSNVAFAAQPDMSMSIEETMRQTTTQQAPNQNEGTGFDNSVLMDPNMAKQMRDIQQRNMQIDSSPLSPSVIGNNDIGTTRRSFMSQFCSSDYNSGQCQNTQREQACQRFRSATVEVQHLLDRAVNCEYSTFGNRASEGDCDGLDAGRLDLLKQYWEDENASYTILFLPDMVTGAASKCGAGGVRR